MTTSYTLFPKCIVCVPAALEVPGIGFAFFDRGRARMLPFGYIVSMGNEAGCEGLDLMQHMLDDERIGVGLMFRTALPDLYQYETAAAARPRRPVKSLEAAQLPA